MNLTETPISGSNSFHGVTATCDSTGKVSFSMSKLTLWWKTSGERAISSLAVLIWVKARLSSRSPPPKSMRPTTVIKSFATDPSKAWPMMATSSPISTSILWASFFPRMISLSPFGSRNLPTFTALARVFGFNSLSVSTPVRRTPSVFFSPETKTGAVTLLVDLSKSDLSWISLSVMVL